jgi:uncharacterized protein (TIGR02996 family)
VNERKKFLKALAKNEDDTTTRMVYADWLDDQGEHEEADRQRKWPAAKAWLVQFCRDHNPPAEEAEESEEWVISYEELLELGRQAVEGAGESGFGLHCGNNMEMCDALGENVREFWENWSIVTGIPLPPDVEEKSYFRCAC